MAFWKNEVAPELPEWCDPISFQVKKIAVRDAINALKEGKKRVKKGIIPYFKLHFRSRKSPVQSCFIPSSAIKESGIYPRVSGKGLRYAEPLPESPMDSRLIFRGGKFYLALPRKEVCAVAENQGRRIVSIDPGIRSFHTFYSPIGVAGSIGRDDFSRIVRLAQHLDDLLSRTSKAGKQRRRRMYRAADRMREKIRNLIDELHHKTARFYVDNFDVILLPAFETSEMARKATRKIRSKSVRSMMTFAHYRFAQFLKHKAFETGKVVLTVTEEYTSKTNPYTGELMTIGSRRRVRIGDDWVDRDHLGAFGIFLKALGDFPDHFRVVAVNES
jgi:putative transposase